MCECVVGDITEDANVQSDTIPVSTERAGDAVMLGKFSREPNQNPGRGRPPGHLDPSDSFKVYVLDSLNFTRFLNSHLSECGLNPHEQRPQLGQPAAVRLAGVAARSGQADPRHDPGLWHDERPPLRTFFPSAKFGIVVDASGRGASRPCTCTSSYSTTAERAAPHRADTPPNREGLSALSAHIRWHTAEWAAPHSTRAALAAVTTYRFYGRIPVESE